MTQKLIPLYDRKRALTKKELQEVEKELSQKTEIKWMMTEKRPYESKDHYFYVLKIKEFREYPQFIGDLHAKYGRGIDIVTYHVNKEIFTNTYGEMLLYIRGYAKEIKK